MILFKTVLVIILLSWYGN